MLRDHTAGDPMREDVKWTNLRDEHRQGRRTTDDLAAAYLGLLMELEKLVQIKKKEPC